MTGVKVIECSETIGVGDRAIEQLPFVILDTQSTEVNLISGATVTSKAIIAAVNDALSQAGLR